MKTIYSSISKRVFSLLVALIMAISTVPLRQLRHLRRNREFPSQQAPLHRIQNRLRLHLHKTLQPALQRSYSLTAEKDMTLINFLAIRA